MIKITFFCLLLLLSVKSYSQNFIWANHFKGPGNDLMNEIVRDSDNNLYATGSGSSSLFSPGSGGGLFLTKFNKDGNVLWTRSFSVPGTGREICLDNSGNIYMAGDIYGYANFGIAHFNPNHIDAFIAKFDPNGKLIWIKQIKGRGYVFSRSISADDHGGCYITGTFNDTITFPGNSQLPNNSVDTDVDDLFLAKFDTAGNFTWSKHFTGLGGEMGTKIKCAYPFIYLAGEFSYQMYCDTYTVIHNGGGNNNDIFFSKLGINGTVHWIKTAGSSGPDQLNDLFLDAKENIYLTGYVTTPAYFDNIEVNNTVTGRPILYISKYDSTGNIKWVSTGESEDFSVGSCITINSNEDILVSGLFRDNISFENNFSLAAASNTVHNFFLAKFKSNGSFDWAYRVDKKGSLGTASLLADKDDGSVYFGGVFDYEVVFPTDNGDIILNAYYQNPHFDVYMAKYKDPTFKPVTTNIAPSPVKKK